MKRAAMCLCSTALALTARSQADSASPSNQTDVARGYELTPMVEGLDIVWGAAFLPDGDLLVTEREGDLHLIDDWQLVPTPIENTPDVLAERQGGLLDIALDPDFEANRLIYLSYSKGTREANSTAIARARLSTDRTTLEDVTDIFVGEFKKSGGAHFGGRLGFMDDGTLLLTLGDGFSYRDDAQKLTNHLGTIVRINTDGSVPPDNPFVGIEQARPEIWSYGHRNVQGLAFDRANDVVYAHEHGPKGGDEINIIKPANNYGWPVISYGVNYDGTMVSNETHHEGMEQPIVKWVPSIAPAGMTFYTGDKHAELKGDLIVSALAGMQIRQVDLEDGKVAGENILIEGDERYRMIITGPDGEIYVSIDNPDGAIFRLDKVE